MVVFTDLPSWNFSIHPNNGMDPSRTLLIVVMNRIIQSEIFCEDLHSFPGYYGLLIELLVDIYSILVQMQLWKRKFDYGRDPVCIGKLVQLWESSLTHRQTELTNFITPSTDSGGNDASNLLNMKMIDGSLLSFFLFRNNLLVNSLLVVVRLLHVMINDLITDYRFIYMFIGWA